MDKDMKELCACNGKECEGICRKEHLNKKDGRKCTAFYLERRREK